MRGDKGECRNNILQGSFAWVTHNEYPFRMAVMLAKTYEAFKEAGASDEKAREAAEEIAAFENRLASIENRLIRVEVLLTVVLAGVVSLVFKTFFA